MYRERELELQEMMEEEKLLDEQLKTLQNDLYDMACDPIYSDYAYMTFDDIKLLSSDTNDTLIAVKAPIGSKIEIPDPDELEQIYLRYGQNRDDIKKY